MATYLGEAILGFGLLAALGFGWHWLGQFRAGAILQSLIISVVYLAWVGLLLFGLFNVARSFEEGVSGGNIGGAIFVALYGGACMLVLLLFPVVSWNFYVRMLNKKWKARFPYVDWLPGPR